jgi:hypothetical protein
MLRYNKKLAATAGAVAAAAAIAVTGVSAASATPRTSPAVTGTEHLQLMSTSGTSNTAPVIVYGVFTGHGVDHEGNKNVDTFVFGNGTFKVRHSNGKGSQGFNPKTCLLSITEHGTYKIFGGTGKFAGISGHGVYHLSILAIGARSKGKCSQTKAPVAFQQLIRASGPVTLP